MVATTDQGGASAMGQGLDQPLGASAAATRIEANGRPADEAPARASLNELRTIYDKVGSVYQRQHPERRAAHSSVKLALNSGRLAKPLFCQRCFRSLKLDAHHPDYRKPLKVVWLCRACHTHVHPRTQKNALSKPVFRWTVRATADDMAAAMKEARA